MLLGGLLFGAWLWLRDSSLVAANQVTISGEAGADAPAIRAALRAAARNMTTLDVQMGQLRTAVAPFPEVKRLRVSTSFPHRLVIEVIEQRPVAVVDVAGRQVPVASDGTLLRSTAVSSALPVIPLAVPPVGRHLNMGRAAKAVAVLAAAPFQLLSKISQVTSASGHGLVAQLRSGPAVYFGDTSQLRAKWLAATAVLADPSSAGASYIDVTVPSRPAAGAAGGAGPTASGLGMSAGATTTGSGTAPTTSSSSPTTATGP